MTVTGVAAPSQAVTYPAPAVSHGAPPVTTTCAPQSGVSFPLGTTTVNCSANDAMSRQAACAFRVTLKGVTLAAQVFDAIGDSFTEGQNGEPGFVDLPNAYPTKLQLALQMSYPNQGIVVINRGPAGSGQRISVIDDNVKKYVRADRPDAVLLEGGYNDLLGDCGNGPTNTPLCRDAIQRVVPVGYRDCIRHAREASTTVQFVFAATLTPQGPWTPGAFDRRISNDAIMQTNAMIRQVVAAEHAVLVDLYPLFVGHEAEYVDTDGLHLRPAGYQAMANAFFAAIQKTVPQTPLFGFNVPR